MADPMQRLSVYLPEELQPYKEDLEFFVSLMVRKLHTNRHKGTGIDLNPVTMLEAAIHEIDEAKEAILFKGQFETAVECADVANFAFLAAMASLQMTRRDFKALIPLKPNAVTMPEHVFINDPVAGECLEIVLVDGTKVLARVYNKTPPKEGESV